MVGAFGGPAGAGAEDLRPAGATPDGGVLGFGAAGGALLIGAGFGAAGAGFGAVVGFEAAAAAASRSCLISSELLTTTPFGSAGFFGFADSAGASSAGAASAFCFEPYSSTSDSADILSMVLEALLTSNPRLRRSSMSSLFSIPTCLES